MLRDRLLAAIFGLPMLFLLLGMNAYLRAKGSPDDLPLLFIVLIIAAVSGYEVSRVVRRRYPATSPWNGVYAAVILPFLVHAIRLAIVPGAAGTQPVTSLGLLIDSVGVTVAVMLLFLGVWSDVEQRGATGLKENLVTLLAGFYLGATLSAVLLLAETRFREMAVFFAFGCVFMLDTVAYFGGKHFGGPRLAPAISPRKTWAGAISGLLATVLLALAFKFVPLLLGYTGDRAPVWLIGAHLSWLQLAWLGFGVGVFGQIGDLVESAFKRWGGVKDSGSILPGHGGFLDRFDSLLLAAPICYLLLVKYLHIPLFPLP